jgi:competence protein ComEC
MFSFFAAGRAWSRDASVYNILAAAAFCMLVVNPRLLFDVGFQLSFAAVTGIVSWQGDIYRSLYLAHPVPDYLWKLISVSVAAQLATFPLSLYYFQQFPLLFWLSGLIAVPAAGLILGGGLSLLLLGSVPWLGKTVGWLLNELISLVNASIAWISGLPCSRLSGLWIDGWVVGLWYALIFALVLAFYRRRGKYWLPVLGLLLLLLVYRAVRRWSAVVQRQVVIYAVPGHSLIDLFDGAGAITLADSLLDEQQEAYAAEKFRLYRSIKRRETYHIGERLQNRSCWYEHGLLQFHHFRLLILGPDTPLSHLPDLRVDAVLIRGDPPWNPERVLSVIRCRKVILDASCSYPTLQRWRRYCARRHLSFQDLRRDGAFVLDLNQHSTIYL